MVMGIKSMVLTLYNCVLCVFFMSVSNRLALRIKLDIYVLMTKFVVQIGR
jgi:hypothetical protein